MKERVAQIISKSAKLNKKAVLDLLEIPKDSMKGDFAFPCFALAKKFKKSPVDIAKLIKDKIENSLVLEDVQQVGGYVNIFVNRLILTNQTIKKIKEGKEKFGSNKEGKRKKILIEMSSPNIAKPFGIGHLRSTIIGNSLSEISKFSGYNVKKINYLGDWGSQFGKLIAGYEKFGKESELKKDPISHLFGIYVKSNENKEIEESAKEWFRKLELGDKKAHKLWKNFREVSIIEFNRIYRMLNIKFDILSGESDYHKDLLKIVHALKRKNLLKESEGAHIVNLEKYGLGIAIIKKADGTTIYMARDVAAAISRKKKYKFDKMIYEVGSEQRLHFKQLFKILELMGYKWAKNCNHVSHGLYLAKDGKKLATRKGKTVFMEDIINDAKELAKKEILKRENKISKKDLEERSHKIALAAIIYGDLKNYRQNDVVFDLERFTSFEGDTGPYLLYSYARARNILKKAKYKKSKKVKPSKISDSEKRLVFGLNNLTEAVKQSQKSFSPNIIASYCLNISQLFNEFYHSNRVIGSENEQFRLTIVDCFSQVLKNALNLLGISTLERM